MCGRSKTFDEIDETSGPIVDPFSLYLAYRSTLFVPDNRARHIRQSVAELPCSETPVNIFPKQKIVRSEQPHPFQQLLSYKQTRASQIIERGNLSLRLVCSHTDDVPTSTSFRVQSSCVQPQFLGYYFAEWYEPPAYNRIVRKDFDIMQIRLSTQVV